MTEEQPPAPAPTTPAPAPTEDGVVLASPYVQITEAVATPLEAGEALETRDAYGRVPVVVRIQRQTPIKVEWILVAIALGASGLFLPLFLALKAVIIVAAVAALFVGILSRIFLRVPTGSVGLVTKGGRHERVIGEGVRRVSPVLALSHIVTTRELAFDVPVSEVRSSDGIAVTVDLLLTLGIKDPVKLVYSITTSDLDQLVHATTMEAVRTLIRGIDAFSTLDLGAEEAGRMRAAIDEKLETFGIEVRAVAFTRVALPNLLMASLEARRLAAVQLMEEEQSFALDQRRITDRAALIAQEAESRRAAIRLEAEGEAVRLGELDARLAANPLAARYDLELQRLRVAEQLAGNSRAVVSLGGSDLLADLLVAREATPEAPVAGPAPVAATPAPAPAAPAPAADDGSRPRPVAAHRAARATARAERRGEG